MKLYNNTRVPDSIIEAVLYKAGRAVGARTTNVIVEVNTARNFSVRGTAWYVSWIKGYKGLPKGRKVTTDGGMFCISLPRPRSFTTDKTAETMALNFAESFFNVARHEWSHIKDYQVMDSGTPLAWSGRKGGRRPKWANRPEEMRAENHCVDANLRGKDEHWAAEEILSLALELLKVAK
jgi:hypothetical protein